MKNANLVLALAAALLLPSCPLKDEDESQTAAVVDRKTVDAAGGTLSGADLTVTIPPNALSAATEIVLTRLPDPPPSANAPLSPLFRFEPDGLTFAQPVRVTMTASGDAAGASIFWSRPDQSYERLASTVQGSTVTASVSHFCTGFVGRPSAGGTDGGTGPDPEATLVGVAGDCALASDGTVRCWSAGYAKAPVAIEGLSGVAQLAAGNAHLCARLDDGTVTCWGGPFGETLAAVPGLAGVKQIAAAGDYACALLSDGAVKCWGDNEFGQLGDGKSLDLAVPFTVPLGGPALELALGNAHACARIQGAVKCWGSNMGGELGNGGTRERYVAPVQVTGLSDALQLAAGNSHTCARLTGKVLCWGMMLVDYGGTLVQAPQATPVEVSGLGQMVEIALGDGFGCARSTDASVWCWGANAYGQLGDGTTADRLAPAASRATDATLLAVIGSAKTGRLTFSFARKSDGSLWGWGRLPGALAQANPEPVKLAW